MKKKRMGRPPLPKSQLKSMRMSFRVTPALRKALLDAAKREGVPVGRYITDTLKTRLTGGV